MKKEKKNYNSSISNYSSKNPIIAESLTSSVNNMNKTTSESIYKKNDIKNKDSNNKILNNDESKKDINHNNSCIGLNIKKHDQYFLKNFLKNDNNSNEENNYQNSFIENEKVSREIYNNLDKIRNTLLEDFKRMIPKMNEKNYLNNNKKEKNDNNTNIRDNKFTTIPIKSRTCISFYKNNKPNNEVLDSNNVRNKKQRLKSTGDNRDKSIQVTRYLDRKKINELPVTYPIYFSYKNKYNSKSEKDRIDKILNKLICLKTHLFKDPLNKKVIIKEFFVKNGFNENKYFSIDSINNFYNYIKKPFSFPSNYNLSDVINDGINFKKNKNNDDNEENIDISKINFLDYIPKYIKRKIYKDNIQKKKFKNNSMDNENKFNINFDIINKRKINYEKYKNISLPVLIKELEYELKQIKKDKMKELDKYNNLIDSKKALTFKLYDNNKYVPNLCLISKGFKERCKSLVDKKNKKIIKNINKKEHLKKINDRLYYDYIRKNNLMELDRDYIQRKLKLTEFVVMERAKKNLLYEKVRNNFINSLESIGKIQ